jgi:hypothetical protein
MRMTGRSSANSRRLLIGDAAKLAFHKLREMLDDLVHL